MLGYLIVLIIGYFLPAPFPASAAETSTGIGGSASCPENWARIIQGFQIESYPAVDIQFYEQVAPHQLVYFWDWLKSAHPEVIRQYSDASPKLRSLPTMFQYHLDEPEIHVFERLSQDHWKTLDREFLQAMKEKVIRAKSGLVSLTENLLRMKESESVNRSVSFKSQKPQPAIVLGSGIEGRVYKVQSDAGPRVIKVFTSAKDYEAAKKIQMALSSTDAPVLRLLDWSDEEKSLALEFVPGVMLGDIKAAEKKGQLPSGTGKAADILVGRVMSMADSKYHTLAEQAGGQESFNPHFNNWLLMPLEMRFVLIDTR